MCGIVGSASITPQQSRDWLAIAAVEIRHRGPDAKGEWWSQCRKVGMAHRRLSIVDLSESASQPMHLKERGLTIVFNGEIYNHKVLRRELESIGYTFNTSSDTEVLLVSYAHWGMDCLEKLNGMFSFALFDATKNIVVIARDRSGEKPLFYTLKDGVLYFSSELKALVVNDEIAAIVDRDSLDCYLYMGYVPGDMCILKGFNKLKAGHALTFCLNTGALDISQYWSLPSYCDTKLSVDELEHELELLLTDAVKRQLIADVPVGILLSGGVDSSLVTALAASQINKVKTFNISFPGYANNDEAVHARNVASHFGTDHIELSASSSSVDQLPLLVKQFDEPMADTSMFPTWLVCGLVKNYCKVALGGDGGDELFGGYSHYSRLLAMRKLQSRIPQSIRGQLSSIVKSIMPVGMRGRNYVDSFGIDLDRELPLIVSFFDFNLRQQLMSDIEGYQRSLVAEKLFKSRLPNQSDLIQRATRVDFENYLAEDILVKIDRVSMMHSLEMRAPLLDYKVVEFAFGKVPSALKANQHERKILLKRVAKKYLPANFELNRKQGFSIPLRDWLIAGPYRELFWDVLLNKNCVFNRSAVEKLLRNQDRGYNNGERLFSLVLFELWRKEYNVSM